jgi:hypothetical protein
LLILLLLAPAVYGQEPPPEQLDPAWQPPPAPPQPPPPPVWVMPRPGPTPEQLAEAAELERSGKRMRAGGFAFLAIAIAAEVTGQVLVLYSQLAASTTCVQQGGMQVCTTDSHIPELASGIVLGLVGGGSIYGSTAVISAGTGRIRRAKLLRMQIRPEFGAHQLGASAVLHF